MKLTAGNKEIKFGVRDLIYIVSMVGIGAGWYADRKIYKDKFETMDVTVEQMRVYVEENSDNIIRITTILELGD